MRKYILILFTVFGFGILSAQTKSDADKAYSEGRYDYAIKVYSSLLDKGVNADLYYNLANSYYRNDEYAKAILNYERALLLSPGDEDINFNLDMARTKIVDKIVPKSEMFFIMWYKKLVDSLSVDVWAIWGIVLFVLSCILAFIYLFVNKVLWRKVGFFGTIFCLLLSVCFNVFAYNQYKDVTVRNYAIIMLPSIEVKSTPNASGTDLFVLHEGTKVEILDDSMKDWKEVRLADGKVGWISSKSMEVI